MRANSSSLDIDLFKDYSKDVTSPLRSRPTAMTGPNGKAWTLPERGRRHHMNRTTLSSNHGKSYAHSQESLPEDFNVYERTKSDALTIPQSRKKTHEMGTQVTPGIDENIPDIIKTDDKKKMKKIGLRRQNSANISTQTTDELSDSSSLDVIANTKPQWMHRPEDLVKGCCNYTASVSQKMSGPYRTENIILVKVETLMFRGSLKANLSLKRHYSCRNVRRHL